MRDAIGLWAFTAFWVVFGGTILWWSHLAAQTVNSGNPNPSPVGIVSANVAVCDPYNPMNCLTPGATTVVNAAGTTGIVTATMAAVAGKTNYLCGVEVDVVGGTAAVSPMSLTGVLGGTITYQGFLSAAAPGLVFTRNYSPCLAASAANIAIALATTADGTATSVTVILWGFTH
jgi:hypothetical protein